MSNITKIYVVGGQSSYGPEDTKCWLVTSYDNEEQANAHVKAAQKDIKEKIKKVKKGEFGRKKIDHLKNRYDPNMQIDWDMPKYGVIEVPLFCHFDQFQEDIGL